LRSLPRALALLLIPLLALVASQDSAPISLTEHENPALLDFEVRARDGIVIAVAVITPSGDPYTLMVMSVPMYLFYEIAIIFGRVRERRRKSANAE